MKCFIYNEELYPDYGICPDENGDKEVTEELYARWQAVCKAYSDVQIELGKLYK